MLLHFFLPSNYQKTRIRLRHLYKPYWWHIDNFHIRIQTRRKWMQLEWILLCKYIHPIGRVRWLFDVLVRIQIWMFNNIFINCSPKNIITLSLISPYFFVCVFFTCQKSVVNALYQCPMGWRVTCIPIQTNDCLLFNKFNPMCCWMPLPIITS